jgi:hypothetical protein
MEHKKDEKALLKLLVRAAELIEEVFTRQPDLIHDDHAQDYADIMTALHANQVFYRANPKIMQMAHNYNPLNAFGKMPMEKAKRAKPKEDIQNVG